MKTIQMVNIGGQWVATQAKKKSKALAAGGTALFVSASSFAVDHSTAIAAAGTDGTANTTAAALVVIAIASVVTGITLVLGLLRK
ncbi:MAG: hypothetical protein HRT55_18620 [Colwellia sp.]|uniref:hypothetical protein n=1 Tax=Colwellia sp. TaxID=56799 RepID=UPI0025C10182|nr:hypothetical protein [Colwellia sp.]NQZ28316.1 hypothetical protein [Colwellia sp.]